MVGQARGAAKGSHGGRPPAFDTELYKQRNVVERTSTDSNQFRDLATRYACKRAMQCGTRADIPGKLCKIFLDRIQSIFPAASLTCGPGTKAETVQTRHGIKEVAPRLVAGFLAGALSMWVATHAIEIANGLDRSITGGGVDASTGGDLIVVSPMGQYCAVDGLSEAWHSVHLGLAGRGGATS